MAWRASSRAGSSHQHKGKSIANSYLRPNRRIIPINDRSALDSEVVDSSISSLRESSPKTKPTLWRQLYKFVSCQKVEDVLIAHGVKIGEILRSLPKSVQKKPYLKSIRPETTAIRDCNDCVSPLLSTACVPTFCEYTDDNAPVCSLRSCFFRDK